VRFRRAYLILIILVSAQVPTVIYDLDFPKILDLFLLLLVLTSNYYGLRDRKSWVVSLILIFSVNGCFFSAIGFLEPARDMMGLFQKIPKGLLVLFCYYQAGFFRKREVMRFFGDRGEVFF